MQTVDSSEVKTAVVEKPGPKTSFYLPALDGLRFFAFLMVFMRHALPRMEITGPLSRAYDTFVMAGAYGVPLFFALSAYLITTLLMKEKAMTNDVNVLAFYQRRILRIWPLFYLILILAYFGNRLAGIHAVGTIPMLRLATFNGNFAMAGGAVYPMSVAILWSVCVEEQFYLTWPWFAKWLKSSGLTIAGIAMIAIGLGYRLWAANKGLGPDLWYSSPTNLDCFGFGILFALHGKTMKLKMAGRTALIIASLAGIFAVVGFYPTTDLRPYITVEHLSYAAAIGFSLVAFLCALIVLLIAQGSQTTFLAKVPFNYLGRISYGLYCYHTLVLTVMPKFFHGESSLEKVVAFFVTIGVASLSFTYFERVFLRMRGKLQVVRSGDLR
ncbi:MAG TPA: acyltransferase [Fimbriimonadaceae bacterium]|jgi:peptidoglycan/LPS O-acetylase OafA/YrhL